MNGGEFASVVLSSAGVSLVTAGWLAQKLVEHRLTKDLETFKTQQEEKLELEKAEWDGRVRQKVETVLAERAADRDYVLQARKRLYSAIGPLKFQLLVACRDLSGRIKRHATFDEQERIDVDDYYGRSTLYRILRPIALTELVERQISYADFGVDPDAVNLLTLKKNIFGVLSGGEAAPGLAHASTPPIATASRGSATARRRLTGSPCSRPAAATHERSISTRSSGSEARWIRL